MSRIKHLTNEQRAYLAGWPKLAAIYRAERRCPDCNGLGEFEDDRIRLGEFGLSRWRQCKCCEGTGQVQSWEASE